MRQRISRHSYFRIYIDIRSKITCPASQSIYNNSPKSLIYVARPDQSVPPQASYVISGIKARLVADQSLQAQSTHFLSSSARSIQFKQSTLFLHSNTMKRNSLTHKSVRYHGNFSHTSRYVKFTKYRRLFYNFACPLHEPWFALHNKDTDKDGPD